MPRVRPPSRLQPPSRLRPSFARRATLFAAALGWLALGWFALCWFAPAPAFAQTTDTVSSPAVPVGGCASTQGKSTRQLVDDGKAHARKSEWACARESLRTAYAKQESFDVAGNLGIVTHELAKERGDVQLYAEAAAVLAASLRGFPVSGDAGQRKILEDRAAECRARVVALRLDLVPAGACVTLSGHEAGCGPFAYDLFAPPGQVVILAQAPGYETKEVKVDAPQAGSHHEVKIDLSLSKAAAGPTPATPTSTSKPFPLWPTFLAGGLAVVGFGVGAGLWIAGDDARAEGLRIGDETSAREGRDNFCAPPIAANLVETCTEIDFQLRRHDDLHNAATGLFVASGVVTLGAGALLMSHFLVKGSDEGADSARWMLTPMVSPRGDASLTLSGVW